MKTQNKTDINKIKNIYILKSLFYYLDYPYFLKLIKKNKRLRNKLNINIQNYKDIAEYPKYEYTKSTSVIQKRGGIGGQEFAEFFIAILSSCCTCIMFIYMIIYSILLVSKGNFNDNNIKENSNKSSVDKIKIINNCTFILDAIIISSPFLFIFYIFKNYEKDYGIKKVIKIVLIVFIDFIHIIFEGLIIWKLVISYKIKKNGVTWFMAMDYVFIFLNIFYLAYLLFFSLIFFADSGRLVEIVKNCYLTSFNDIKIESYILCKFFTSVSEKDRKKFILDNHLNFRCKYFHDEENIINKINNMRNNKDISELGYNYNMTIPDWIINKPTELMLNPTQNIIRFSEKKFLLKYPIGKFMDFINDNDIQLIDIILKENLNFIEIITQKNYQYILIYHKDFYFPYRNIFNKGKYSYKKYDYYKDNEPLFKNLISKNYDNFN